MTVDEGSGHRGDASDQAPDWLTRLAKSATQMPVPPALRPPASGGRPAAVLILFGTGPNGPDVLLIERAADLRKHAGQPAFPGGAIDEADCGPVPAALREAAEETGVDPDGVLVVGVMAELYIPQERLPGDSGAGLVAHARARLLPATPPRSRPCSGCRWPTWPARPRG